MKRIAIMVIAIFGLSCMPFYANATGSTKDVKPTGKYTQVSKKHEGKMVKSQCVKHHKVKAAKKGVKK